MLVLNNSIFFEVSEILLQGFEAEWVWLTLRCQKQLSFSLNLLLLRYEQAKNMSQDLEKQAARVHEEAKRAGDKAVEIYASVAQLTPVDSEALEVWAAWPVCTGVSCHCRHLSRAHDLSLPRQTHTHTCTHPTPPYTPRLGKSYSDCPATVTGTDLLCPPADSLVVSSSASGMFTYWGQESRDYRD